ncbi:MFS transporter [Peterkaempfera bronchialis]|uniref:MFS transporter n=1 Tax=Peterkaempfera bronchialis TaxID=2126346 RepID=UPI003C2D15D8
MTSPAVRRPDRWLILGVLCLAQLVVVLDNTVLNVAVPSLTRELGAGTADVQWMVSAYSLAQAGLLITAGGLADRYGRKRVQLIGLALFGCGSLAAALADSPGRLIAARAGMGVGGSLLMATTLAILVRVFDAEERPKAIGGWAAVTSLGFAAGPVIGGLLLDHFWWGSVFIVNLPVVVLGLVAIARLVPESKDPRGDRPDLLGAALCTTAMLGLVFAVISGPEHGWTGARTLASAAVGAAALAGFVHWERRTEHPMLDMGFFADPRFRGAISGGVLVAFGMGGSLFLLTQQLQFVLGYDPLQAGVRVVPMAATVVALNMTGLGARLAARVSAPVAIAGGMVLMAGGLAAVALFGRDGSYAGTCAGLVLMGAGVAFAQPAMAAALMGAIPPERAGVGSGLAGTLSELGTSVGVAVLGALLTARFAAGLPAGFGGDAARSLPDALRHAADGPDAAALADRARQAFTSGLTASQLIGAAAVLAGGLVAGHLLRRAGDRAAPAAAQGPGDRAEVAG